MDQFGIQNRIQNIPSSQQYHMSYHRKAQINLRSIQRDISDQQCSKKIQFYSKKITTLKKISANSLTKINTNNSLQGIQNGNHVQLLYKRYRKISQNQAKILFLVIILNLIYVQDHIFQFQQQTKLIVSQINDKSTLISLQQRQHVRLRSSQLIWISFIISIFASFLTVLRYYAKKLVYDSQKIGFLNLSYLILEILIIMMQPMPGLNQEFMELNIIKSGSHYVLIKENHIMCILALLKLMFLIRQCLQRNNGDFLQINSRKFFRPSYNRICKIYSCENDYLHIMKCIFKDHFVVFITLVHSFLLLLGAYVIRIAQINYDGRFLYFQNAFWLTLMSIKTIGYGDLYPSTSLGVVLDAFSAYAGVIITSMLLASLTDLFTMGYRERRSLLILKRLNMKEDMKQSALKFIQYCLFRLYKQKKLNKTLRPSLQQKQYQMQFHNKRMDLKCNKEGSLNLFKQMYDQFQAVKLRLDQIIEIQHLLMITLSDKERLALQTVRSNKILRKNSLEDQQQKNLG